MPRSGTGTYTLPTGNPVVTGTTIETTWANNTLSDIATAMTDSLSRSGQGGMTAALRIADGTQGAPGVGFANETGSGLYRAGTGEVWAVVQGSQTLNLDASGVTVPSDKTTSIEGTFVFNETGADKDARFEGDTDVNLLFTDASTDRVGVGTNAPSTKFTVRGAVQSKEIAVRWERATDGAVSGGLGYFYDSENSVAVGAISNHPVKLIVNDATVATIDTSGNLGVGTIAPTFGNGSGVEIQRAGAATLRIDNTLDSNSFELYADTATNGINLRGRDSSPMLFWTGNTERFRIGTSGQFGVAGSNYGTSGQIFTSQGASAAPQWSSTLTNTTIETANLTNGYTEEVFALGTTGSIALNPVNGSIQTCALTGNPTFTDSLSSGQSIVLMLTNGASYTVTWPTVTWVRSIGNTAPTLTSSDVFVFWKVSTTLYAAYVGSGA